MWCVWLHRGFNGNLEGCIGEPNFLTVSRGFGKNDTLGGTIGPGICRAAPATTQGAGKTTGKPGLACGLADRSYGGSAGESGHPETKGQW